MHLSFYKALVGLNIPPEQATEVVMALEAHIDQRVGQSTDALLAKLTGMESNLQARLDLALGLKAHDDKVEAQAKADQAKAKEARTQLIRWTVTTAIGAVAATVGVMKLLGIV